MFMGPFRTQLDTVVKYVLNQEVHHQKKSFREEYIEMLIKNEIDYKEESLFDFLKTHAKGINITVRCT